MGLILYMCLFAYLSVCLTPAEGYLGLGCRSRDDLQGHMGAWCCLEELCCLCYCQLVQPGAINGRHHIIHCQRPTPALEMGVSILLNLEGHSVITISCIKTGDFLHSHFYIVNHYKVSFVVYRNN